MTFVSVLCVYHYKIMVLNLTTNEHLKGVEESAHFRLNETKGFFRELSSILCGRIAPSVIPNNLIR